MENNNQYQFFLDGQEFQQEYLNLIKGANESIILHTYIFELDSFGTQVFECLEEKAKQGIIVNLTIDYFGSYFLNQKLKKQLSTRNNINITFFNPLISPKVLQAGRRLHHKVLIIDQTLAMIGGINIIDGKKAKGKRGERLDFAVKVRDNHVEDLYTYCLQISQMLSKEVKQKPLLKIGHKSGSSIFFHYNDWFNNRKEITSRYMSLIKSSRNSIHLIHGYFFPSLKIINALIKKSKEGIKIKITLPKYSDWQGWVWATEYLYSEFIKNGIEIYEWQLSELHGKLGIFDEEIVLVGSYNLNYTSSYGNLEMNIEIKNSAFTKEIIQNELTYISNNSKNIDLKTLSNWNLLSKVRNLFFYLVLSLSSSLLISWAKINRHFKNMSFFKKLF